MKTNSREERLEKLLLPAFGVYIAALLWVTLLSRIGSDTRHIYPPFWSFKAIGQGSADTLWETIGNIVLLIPFGYFVRVLTGWKRRYVVLAGLGVSILLELTQWTFRLGSTELDDVITNTIGTTIGACLARPDRQFTINRKTLIISSAVFLILLLSPFIFQHLRIDQMTELAALSDRDDGTKNLLVLNGEPGYVGESEVYVSYNRDGSIKISGQSDEVGYKLIGRLNLEPGDYSFSGFSGAEPNTVSIYLEKYDAEKDGFYRFTPDLGPIEKTTFSLAKTEKVRAYVKVYPGASGEYIAKPVIFREG